MLTTKIYTVFENTLSFELPYFLFLPINSPPGTLPSGATTLSKVSKLLAFSACMLHGDPRMESLCPTSELGQGQQGHRILACQALGTACALSVVQRQVGEGPLALCEISELNEISQRKTNTV